MKQTLIAFQDEMMLKIITGEKIRTRRLINPQPQMYPNGDVEWKKMIGARLDSLLRYCPYGKVGDELLCREALRKTIIHTLDDPFKDRIMYSCDEQIVPMSNWLWKRNYLPARYMPSGLVRYALPLSVVRVERLQDITDQEAKGEGITDYEIKPSHTGDIGVPPTYKAWRPAVGEFVKLWDSINARRYPWASWEANPFVWVLGWEADDVKRI
jgi:hypothetical protein